MSNFKRIADYDDQELKDGIKSGVDYCANHGLDFWVIFKAIDCYNEQRQRKLAAEKDGVNFSKEGLKASLAT